MSTKITIHIYDHPPTTSYATFTLKFLGAKQYVSGSFEDYTTSSTLYTLSLQEALLITEAKLFSNLICVVISTHSW
jgi:hypothetical protein